MFLLGSFVEHNTYRRVSNLKVDILNSAIIPLLQCCNLRCQVILLCCSGVWDFVCVGA